MSYETWMADAGGRARLAGKAARSVVERYKAENPGMPEYELARLIAGRERLRADSGSLAVVEGNLIRKLYRGRKERKNSRKTTDTRISLDGMRHRLSCDFTDARYSREGRETERWAILAEEEKRVEEMSDNQVTAIFLRRYNSGGTPRDASF